MRVFVFEEDPSVLELLVLYLEQTGHHAQGFRAGYTCPLYLLEECVCPADKPCAEAVIVNTKVPTQESLQILIDQDQRKCKLPKANKAVMSAYFNPEREKYFQEQGFTVIKKPFRLSTIATWLNECSDRLVQLYP